MNVRSVAGCADVLEKVIAGTVYFSFGCKFAEERTSALRDITGKTDCKWKVGFGDC